MFFALSAFEFQKKFTDYNCCPEYKADYQKCLDEYCFRANRLNTEQSIFQKIMQRVVTNKTKTFKELKANAVYLNYS